MLPQPARGDSLGASGPSLHCCPLSCPRRDQILVNRSHIHSSGPAPCTALDDQTQQLEGVPRLHHGFRPPTPPERLHPTLSSWPKNMNKLSDLVDRLQELASAAPMAYRPQLHRQVATSRMTFKRQQERCIEFLRLAEEYANHTFSISLPRSNNKVRSLTC